MYTTELYNRTVDILYQAWSDFGKVLTIYEIPIKDCGVFICTYENELWSAREAKDLHLTRKVEQYYGVMWSISNVEAYTSEEVRDKYLTTGRKCLITITD